MTAYDIVVLVVITGLVVWGIWDWRRKREQKQFVGTTLLLLAPILISLASLLFGVWGCHKFKNTVIDKFFGKEAVVETEVVSSVESGNVIKLKAGVLKKSRRTKKCILWGILIPSEVEKQSKENLSNMISPQDEIRVIIKEGNDGLFGADRGDISGIPIAKNGENCCLEQLRIGLAKSTVEDKTFLAAQKEAQKAYRGIWTKKTKEEMP